MAAKFATLARNPQDPDSIKELKKAQESARIIYAFQKKVLTFDPVTGVITPLHHTVAEKPGEFIGDPSVSEGQRQAALRDGDFRHERGKSLPTKGGRGCC